MDYGHPIHTTFFWNIIIQSTSHDDLTEKSVLAKPPIKWWWCKKNLWNGKKLKLHFVIWRKNCFRRILSAGSQDWDLPQIFKSMDGSSWKKIYYISFYSIFSLWMACFNSNVNDLDFVPKDKSKLIKIVAKTVQDWKFMLKLCFKIHLCTILWLKTLHFWPHLFA